VTTVTNRSPLSLLKSREPNASCTPVRNKMTLDLGFLGGVLARRTPGGVGQRGQHAEAVGCGQRRPAAHLCGAFGERSGC
jgi:hypothetical protein